MIIATIEKRLFFIFYYLLLNGHKDQLVCKYRIPGQFMQVMGILTEALRILTKVLSLLKQKDLCGRRVNFLFLKKAKIYLYRSDY